MSNGKPTPGPWTVTSSDAGLWIEPPNRGEAVICDLVPRQTLYSAEDDANARLIAAAPDLLEALRTVEAAFFAHASAAIETDAGWVVDDQQHPWIPGAQAWPVIEIIRAAIKKAEGI